MNDGVLADLRLRDVKWSALIACLATLLGVAIPMWNFTHQILALKSNIGELGAFAVILVAYVFTATVPSFCFALYLDAGELRLSWNTRWMALTGAAVIGILSASAISGWIASFRRESVLNATARPWTISDTASLLSLIADLGGILLLITLFRLARDGSSQSGVAASKLLCLLTKIAVIAGGIVTVGCVIGLAATPWVYFQVRARSLDAGHSNSIMTFSQLALDRFRAALGVISVYVAPFVVWHGSRTRVAER